MDGHEKLDEALKYAAYGWKVVRLYPVLFPGKCGCRNEGCSSQGKHPVATNWPASATDDEATISEWRGEFNIGVKLGPDSGIIDIECDSPEAERELLELFDDDAPITATYSSGRGKHRLFAWSDDLPDWAKQKAKHDHGAIEFRTGGGARGAQSVFPPSDYKSGGNYAWLPGLSPDDVEPAELPARVLKKLKANDAPKHHSENGRANDHCNGHIAETTRNNTLISLAGSMRRRGFDVEAIEAALHVKNRKDCKPPLPDGDISIIARSAGRYDPDHEASKPVERDAPIPSWEPFPTHLLPYPLSDYVRAGAAAINCDESFVALPLLCSVAGAIGNTRRVKIKRTWSEPAVLWGATVGESGSAKSPGNETGTRPVFDAQREARRQFKQDFAKWQQEHEAWRQNGEQGPEPEEPRLPVYWIDDATVEAVGAILLENERGTFVASEELAGWFGSFDAYRKGKGGDAAKWLRMHGGRELRIDRRTGTPRVLYIPFASVSITGTIQPGILRKQLTAENRDSGMAARLLFAWPPRRPIRWTDAEVDEETSEAVADLFTWLYSLELWTDARGDRKPSLVPLSDDAKDLFRQFVDDHGEEHAAQSGDLAAAFSKLIGYAARFALLFALVRMQTRETDEPTEAVDRQSMADGIALARWFSSEAVRVYRLIDAGQAEQDRAELVDWIRKKGGTVTPRDVQRLGPSRCRQSSEVMLRDLVARGLATAELTQPGENGGRPAECFTITT